MKNNPFFKILMAITLMFAIMFSTGTLTGQLPGRIEAFVPVTKITDVPATAIAGSSLTLGGTVLPPNATCQHIIWSIESAGKTGATISGNRLTTIREGIVTVLATIKNGKKSPGTDFTQKFTINVVALRERTDGQFHGSGTDRDPYLIINENDLRQLSVLINAGTAPYANEGKQYRLAASFTMANSNFKPIGTDKPFYGHFDGNNQTITNLTSSNQQVGTGLFGHIQNGTIKNVGLLNVNINGKDNTGGITGSIRGQSASITGCYVTGYIYSTGNNVGGIVGDKSAALRNCYTTCSVNATGYRVGGIAGNSHGVIVNCWASGSIGGRNNCGGIAGWAYLDVYRCMALNQSVTTTGDNNTHFVGRVTGGDSSHQLECVAWANMRVNSAIISGTGNADSKDGLSISYRQIITPSAIETYCPGPQWTKQGGMLPGLMGNCVQVHSHLTN